MIKSHSVWILIEQSGHEKTKMRKNREIDGMRRNERGPLVGEACFYTYISSMEGG